jgi:hypothetical protein
MSAFRRGSRRPLAASLSQPETRALWFAVLPFLLSLPCGWSNNFQVRGSLPFFRGLDGIGPNEFFRRLISLAPLNPRSSCSGRFYYIDCYS